MLEKSLCIIRTTLRRGAKAERSQLTFSGAGWSSLVARRAHNPKVVGSNPAPATTENDTRISRYALCMSNRSDAGWSSLVARRAHNPKVVGSNPAPATNKSDLLVIAGRFFLAVQKDQALNLRPIDHLQFLFLLDE